MKKKLILLPVLMFALAACGSSSSPSSSAPPSSEAPFVDTNVWRVVGSFGTSNWTVDNDDYKMVKAADKNEYTFVGLDLYVNNEWTLAKNGDWPGQIGFTSPAAYVTIVDAAETMVVGDGPSIKNFKVVTEGKYTLKLETVATGPYTLTITRTGDASTPPVTETDTEEWYLIGTMNEWSTTNEDFPLEYDEVLESYIGTYELDANTSFKIKTPEDGTWAYARGYAQVDIPTPAPAWLENHEGNVRVTEAGLYTVRFVWIASVGATVNGTIFITQHDSFEVPAAHILADKALGDPVSVDEVEVLGNVDKFLFLANEDGTLLVNYYGIAAEDQGPWALLAPGDHISVTGEVANGAGLATGAKIANAATFELVPASFFIEGFELAGTYDLSEGADAIVAANADFVPQDARGLLYKFENVKFATIDSAPANTSFSYFYVSSGTQRLGIYKASLPATVQKLADDPDTTYTVYGVVVGSRAANDLFRISFLVEVVANPAPAVE